MATPEHRILTRVLQTGELKEVLSNGITPEDFLSLTHRAMWEMLVSYYENQQTAGSVVSPEMFRSKFPEFDLVEAPGMTTTALCHELRSQRLAHQIKEVATQAVEEADTDPLAAAIRLRELAEEVLQRGNTNISDVRLSEHIDNTIENYLRKESGEVQPVIHWPWAPLDEETGGVADEDYVLFWGRPKSKKTFVITYTMAQAYLEQNKRILCYTKEMSPDNMLLRIAAFLGKLPYREIRLGKLSAHEKATLLDLKEFVRYRAEVTGGRNDLIVLSGQDANGNDGVSWLRSRVEMYEPDILFVDGLYLLKDDRSMKRTADWQRVTNISRDVRQMVLKTKVPVIATMQANRSAAKNKEAALDEIAFADAVGQDITQGFRVINDKNSPTIALVAGGSREYQLHGIRIYGIPCSNFGFKSVMSEKEIEQAAENDGENDMEEAHAKPRKRKLKKSSEDDHLDAALARLS